ncbi:chemotaxis-specific protein-glutamate methyltransferase CheB [Halorussus sp. MSC15.2]|uniref:chemotaxis-specific protein-glutamate methyltransferase CheB n=1 Tax=Halorussus sp. MSC15.2 TaxID=2283638 RepID=UPI0013D14F8F|nr:chemotaxis-specific protein-glutamate methyltransferase CheB [Halorussus sp. MSC15.2]NEU56473.1 chemotaxis-specific protein-glutamate methyltransferase CheB [Halorussus sp. MSC15.2]
MTKAVVVDDSHFMRTVISDILEEGGIDVVAQAGDGEEGVEAVTAHDPDVVTMDVEMPRMDGIEAVEEIMETNPVPILMLSAHTEDGADATFEALEKGAVDFLAKPGGEVSTEISAHGDALVEKVTSATRADPESVDDVNTRSSSTLETDHGYVESPTLVVGASTGGPRVVERVLSSLPLEADLRVLVVQHMPDGFTGRFAERLDRRSEYDVREAEDGMRIGGGEAVVAKGDYHMEVAGYGNGRLRIRLQQDEALHGVRPAIDVTMETAAEKIDGPLTGVVLTGMGSDGAAGIEAIKRAGGATVAQDEETCSVFGIPARAIETGCVDSVRPADEVGKAILDTIRDNG